MPKVTFDFETNEEMIEFMKSLPGNETSATAADHGTHSAKEIITQGTEKVKEYFKDEQITFKFETEEEQINRLLAPLSVRLTEGKSPSINVIGAIRFMKEWLSICSDDIEKFIEPICIIKEIAPNDKRRFISVMLKGVCEFVDKHYHDPYYNRKNIVNYIGKTSVRDLFNASAGYGGLCNYLEFAHDYHKHYKRLEVLA